MKSHPCWGPTPWLPTVRALVDDQAQVQYQFELASNCGVIPTDEMEKLRDHLGGSVVMIKQVNVLVVSNAMFVNGLFNQDI